MILCSGKCNNVCVCVCVCERERTQSILQKNSKFNCINKISKCTKRLQREGEGAYVLTFSPSSLTKVRMEVEMEIVVVVEMEYRLHLHRHPWIVVIGEEEAEHCVNQIS